MSEGFFASRSFGISLGIGHTVFNASDNFLFRKFGIFQAADFRAGHCAKALHAALQKQLHGGIRQANQAEHDGISAERIELVVFCDGKHLIVGDAGACAAEINCTHTSSLTPEFFRATS
jgi:hypothetical protein